MAIEKIGRGSARSGRKLRFKANGHTYHFYNLYTGQQEEVEIELLKEIALPLELRCRKLVMELQKSPRNLLPDEERDMLLLCSFSIYIFGGLPKEKLPYVDMSEYAAEYYIQMVKALPKWNPERASWKTYNRFVKLPTISVLAKQHKCEKMLAEALEMNDEVDCNVDRESSDTSVWLTNEPMNRGGKVESHNPIEDGD